VWHQLLDKPRQPQPQDSMNGALLGPASTPDRIRAFLSASGARYTEYPDDESLCAAVANLMAGDNVVGWFQGRMEFGPRALGARSIIGDARSLRLQSTMNLKTKFRESFRPFAPVVLKERVADYFELEPGTDSPYMLLVAPVRADHRTNSDDAAVRGLDRVKQIRSDVPAVTHVDYSARIQTVDRERHGRFYALVKAFEQ
jgi:carbamoyltransferase